MQASKLLTAAALALSSAASAQTQTAPADSGPTIGQQADRTFDRAEDATRRTVNPPPGEPTLGQKAGRLFDRMEGSLRRGVDNVRNSTTGRRDDARMGNAPAPLEPSNGTGSSPSGAAR